MKLVNLMAVLMLVVPVVTSAGHPVDINRASAEELAAALEGVGLTKANAIVAFREQHGQFMVADELTKVTGIGEKTVERNRAFIEVTDKANTAVTKNQKSTLVNPAVKPK